ncbi:MAG: glycine--tRNA ligase [Candidatus Nealsonbacteria bacterium]|nr:glycine--tRNA ligase [Candidatus Nealsonbacteria bacterium]
MEKVVSLCKRRGFIFPGSEIYGGINGFWDKGPLGVALAGNIKRLWWKKFVLEREDMYGLDAAIIMNPKVWEASGHTGPGFADPLRECKKCHHRFRGDDLKEGRCPDCHGELTEEKSFNILVKTFIGPVEDSSTQTYLRGETAQGIFVNFKNVLNSFSPRLPFGLAQAGKAFRNEITPGNYFFRSREFEQMEIEFFVKPGEDETWHTTWRKTCLDFVASLGVRKENLRLYDHPKEKLSHYSKATTDIEYHFPFGWSEIWGIANRTDYDLKQHAKYSGQDLKYRDPVSHEEFTPYVIEPSVGVERLMLSVLIDAYSEDKDRVVLRLDKSVAPYLAAVFPLLANKPELIKRAREVFDLLKSNFSTAWDDRGNIGKRYYSQDEIGTPFCLTIDFQTLEDETITIRDRDTTKQERIKISDLEKVLKEKLG